MLIGDGVEVMFIEGERGRWRRHTIGIGGCLIGDEAEEVDISRLRGNYVEAGTKVD